MNDKIKQSIALETIKILKSRFDSFQDVDMNARNAPFHKAFLRAFKTRFSGINTDTDKLVNISSWLHGFNTALGQTFFEKIAQALCYGEKRKFRGNEFKIYKKQEEVIAEHMTKLKNGEICPNVKNEDKMLAEAAECELVACANFTADCFFEDDEKIVAIELKSVRPNSGQTHDEKQKILKAKAALRRYYKKIPACQNKKIYYYFGFPFDPTAQKDTGYCKKTFMDNMIEFSKFCDPDEILLSDELWSFLSGEKETMTEILNIINDISNDTFYDEFTFLCSLHAIDSKPEKYRDILSRWHLIDEVIILDNWKKFASTGNVQIKRYMNSNIFNNDGKLNVKRNETLLTFIREN